MTSQRGKLPSIIIHDTLIVLQANNEAFILFRADHGQLIGADLLDLLDDPSIRSLADLRMQIAREHDERQSLPEVDYLFKRFDGTRFFGRVNTRHTAQPGEWESTITFLWEY